MSFTTLKANRSIKSSFVNSKAKQGDDQAVDEVSVPTPASNALPPFPSGYLDSFILDKLEVKETNNEGKGLFSKVTFSPGEPSSLLQNRFRCLHRPRFYHR